MVLPRPRLARVPFGRVPALLPLAGNRRYILIGALRARAEERAFRLRLEVHKIPRRTRDTGRTTGPNCLNTPRSTLGSPEDTRAPRSCPRTRAAPGAV